MTDTTFLARPDGLKLAYRRTAGTGPTLVFLPGYMSDMGGSKAVALFDRAMAEGQSALLIDYSGCGSSEGDFKDGTLTQWRDDVLLLIDALTQGPLVLAGSSMGGWLMLLVARAVPDRIAAMVGIAAAPDFTQWGFTDTQKSVLQREGVVFEDNPYGPAPTPTYRGFWESGEASLQLHAPIPIDCPVRLLHGQADTDVPWEIALRLASALRSSDVQTLLIKDGDHRLSRNSDIALLMRTIDSLL